jgi:hypothetical protein
MRLYDHQLTTWIWPSAQIVDEVYDEEAARVMGIGEPGTVCIMIHSGSRGLGHQVRFAWGAAQRTGLLHMHRFSNTAQTGCD